MTFCSLTGCVRHTGRSDGEGKSHTEYRSSITLRLRAVASFGEAAQL